MRNGALLLPTSILYTRVGRYDGIIPCDGIKVSTGRDLAIPFIPEKEQMSAASL